MKMHAVTSELAQNVKLEKSANVHYKNNRSWLLKVQNLVYRL